MAEARKVICNNCKKEIEKQEGDISKTFIECPHCLSKSISIYEIFEEDAVLDIKESYRDKLRNENLKSKEKLRKNIFSGDDLHRKSGKWYKKERIIDRDNDSYKEIVIDPDTGLVIHSCEEPLSQHQGHGSAKKIPDEDGEQLCIKMGGNRNATPGC